MTCPRCNQESFVNDSRQTSQAVRRRRECGCGRSTTYEILNEEAFESEIVQRTRISLVAGRPVLHTRISLVAGRPVLRTTTEYRCACGNEARYVVGDEAQPRYCGVCDVVENGGRGERR